MIRQMLLILHLRVTIVIMVILILKRSRDSLLCTKKETNCVLFYPFINGSVLQVPAYYYYIPCNQTTSCQYKLSKKLVQRIKEAQSVLPSQNRNKTSVPVFYRIIKYLYSFGCVYLNSYAPELVPIFYSAIKHGYRCFIS